MSRQPTDTCNVCIVTNEARETEGARRDGTSVAENYGKLVLRHVRREQGWLWRLSVYKAVWLRTARLWRPTVQ